MSAPACDRRSRLEIVGPEDAPVVVVLGGISASSHVTASAENPEPGWWGELVGKGRAIDTGEFRIASIDYGLSDETGPVTARHQAIALARALDLQGIREVHAVVGTSYGGSVALAFAALEPLRLRRLIVYGAAHESTPAATAYRTLQRQIVELGISANRGREALALARGLATTTYTTGEAYARRFGALEPSARCDAIAASLAAEGERFASRVVPERFLEISRSIDVDRIDAARITAATTLIGVEEDVLVPPSLLRSLAELIGPSCALHVVSSSCGHDAFIEDPDCIALIVTRALAAEGLS